MLTYPIQENGLSGHLIQLDSDSKLRRYRSGAGPAPIGILARDVKAGDVLEYNPLGNTRDIIITNIQWKFKD